MKKNLKWISLGLLLLSTLGGLVGYFYVKHALTFDFGEGPIRKVNVVGWTKLKKGMTQDEVRRLLGAPGSAIGWATSDLGGEKITVPTTWEYNWSSGLLSSAFGGTDPKSYVVRFDDQGKLDWWREPLTSCQTPPPDSRPKQTDHP